MLSHTAFDKAVFYNGKKTDVQQFLIVTVCQGWQVIRHFFMYAHYKYRKLSDTTYMEVMQEWLKDGKYVFLCKNRYGMTYRNDAWIRHSAMEIKRGRLGGYLADPRDIGYDDVLYIKVQDKYKYLPLDKDTDEYLSDMYRAVNTCTFNETLLKQHPNTWTWCLREGYLFNKEKMAAVKIAMRHKYEINNIWRDLIDSLHYLHKDLHNPILVCPQNLKEAHDKWCDLAGRRRRKMCEKMERLRSRIGYGYRSMVKIQTNSAYYTRMRKRFFGLVIAEGDIEIRALQSVQEFKEEGEAMEHCVFNNAYYDIKRRPYCLVLSAKRNGERVETIEVDLQHYTVVQSHGFRNNFTPYHNTIVQMMKKNMDLIRVLNTKKGSRQMTKAS